MCMFNQSFVELLFCLQRSGLFGRIDLQLYNSRMGVLTTNLCLQKIDTNMLSNSGMYDPEDAGIIVESEESVTPIDLHKEKELLVSLKPMNTILKERELLLGII
jgi:hypothetical protein